jgi:hypothetical protein
VKLIIGGCDDATKDIAAVNAAHQAVISAFRLGLFVQVPQDLGIIPKR